mgnify:CR=1 FL=1|jgi:hypothetical protein|nr:MAG TPA: Protein of unknown function (DUF3768) [Caudoviricetes sp.]
MKKVSKTERIRQLNDNFRRYGIGNGEIYISSGVAALSDEDIFRLQQEVRNYEDFSKDNDPYREHDFGSIDFKKEKYFFKIDYYDKTRTFLSPNPADPDCTLRVLTIFHADEY